MFFIGIFYALCFSCDENFFAVHGMDSFTVPSHIDPFGTFIDFAALREKYFLALFNDIEEGEIIEVSDGTTSRYTHEFVEWLHPSFKANFCITCGQDLIMK
jgi:hypothetical protein